MEKAAAEIWLANRARNFIGLPSGANVASYASQAPHMALTPIDRRAFDARGRVAWAPDPVDRQIVEVMAAMGGSQEAICRELVRRGRPCASPITLRAKFPDELAYGKERRIFGYAAKVHSIAMSDGRGSLTACLRLLAYLDPRWRTRHHEDDAPPVSDGPRRRIFLHPVDPEPEDDDGPVIDVGKRDIRCGDTS
jgi:hypothetical protein